MTNWRAVGAYGGVQEARPLVDREGKASRDGGGEEARRIKGLGKGCGLYKAAQRAGKVMI